MEQDFAAASGRLLADFQVLCERHAIKARPAGWGE
jgi:hypothetical protein